MKCWDCGEKEARHPAIVIDGKVFSVCKTCWKNWRPWMHAPGHDCPHCEWCRELLRRSVS